jgi:hypothetical protein
MNSVITDQQARRQEGFRDGGLIRPVAVSDEVMAADRYELLYKIPAGDRLRLLTTVDDLCRHDPSSPGSTRIRGRRPSSPTDRRPG